LDAIRQNRGKEVVGARECLGLTLEIDLSIFVEIGQINGHAGIEYRVQFVAFGSA
jgi:hypothetical protein